MSVSYSELHHDSDLLDKEGNAVVYRATVDNGTSVAFKQSLFDNTLPRKAIEQLMREATKWERVDSHPYIANILE